MKLSQVEILEIIKDALLEEVKTPKISKAKISKLILVKTKTKSNVQSST